MPEEEYLPLKSSLRSIPFLDLSSSLVLTVLFHRIPAYQLALSHASPGPTATSATKTPPPAAAARHQECVVRQLSTQEGFQHVVDGSASLRDYANACRSQCHFERPGNCSAYQYIRAKFGHSPSPGERVNMNNPPFVPSKLPATINIHQQKSLGHVEYGRYSALPAWNRDSHLRRIRAIYVPKAPA